MVEGTPIASRCGTPAQERWLFPQQAAAAMTTRQLSRLFTEAADAAGIKKAVTLHALRHSFRDAPARGGNRYESSRRFWSRQVGYDSGAIRASPPA